MQVLLLWVVRLLVNTHTHTLAALMDFLRLLTGLHSLSLQVHYILQEVVMGGMVLETNMSEIVAQVEVQNRMEKSEVSGYGGERVCVTLPVIGCGNGSSDHPDL